MMEKKNFSFFKQNRLRFALCFIALIFIICFCFRKTTNGTIHDSGCFVKADFCDMISTIDGKHYQPIFKNPSIIEGSLIQEIKKPPYNSFIEFEWKSPKDRLGSVCMFGPIIEITRWKLIKDNCIQEKH